MEPNLGNVQSGGENVAPDIDASEAQETVNESQETVNVVENDVTMDAPAKKKGNGMLIGLVVLVIVALGGIGFGVWAMINGNNQVADVNKQLTAANQQVDELKKQNDELADKLAKQEQEKAEVEEDTSVKVNTEDYIYVGEWGLKIKVPKGLNDVSYALERKEDNSVVLVIAGVKGDNDRLPDFANLSKNTWGLLRVFRVTKGTEMPLASPPTFIFSDGEYDYYHANPQAVYAESDEEKDLEVESVNMIKDMLRNVDNYSAI